MLKRFKNPKLTFLIIFFLGAGIILAFFFNDSFSKLRNNPFASSKVNILIAGYDSTVNGPPRADTIILSSIDIKTNEVGLLFIPRDTRLHIPGEGINRINASHAFGGIELTVETLENFLDVPIDYYVETDFSGFERVINLLGGVKINIKERLHYIDKAGGLYIDLPAGERVLNGKEALHYVRYRGVTGDIGRVERQQKFIQAVIRKVTTPSIIPKLPALYKEFRESVNTNVPVQDITPFLSLAKNVDFSKIKSVMLPGEPKYINGASYWVPVPKKINIIVETLIRSKEYIKNNEYQIDIYNGNGASGVATHLAEDLEKYGFVINKVANAAYFNYQQTIITYYNKEDAKVANSIQELIGGKVEYKEADKTDLEIIIGQDYIDKENKEE